MKNPALSLWLSAANQGASWWMGHAANAVRQQQRAVLNEMTKVATGPKPKRTRKIAAKRKKGAR